MRTRRKLLTLGSSSSFNTPIIFILEDNYYVLKRKKRCNNIKKVNEKDFEYRNGDSGVKYLMRGPSIDWGIILLKPGELMGRHGHNEIDETFYFIEENGVMFVDDKEYNAPQGSVFLVEPKEYHDIKNTSDKPLKIVFIKGDYKPNDKI